MPPRTVDLKALELEVRKAIEDVAAHGHGRVEVEFETRADGRQRALVRVMKSDVVVIQGAERPTE